MSDFYEVLGVSRRATSDEITRAYKEMVVKCHPDRHAQNDLQELAEEKLKQANAAYQVLSNPQKRRLYDAGGGRPQAAGPGFQQVQIPPRSLVKMALMTGAWLIAIPLAFRLSHNPKLFTAILAGVFVWRLWRKRRKINPPDDKG